MKKSFRGSASFSNLGCVSEVIATHIIFFLNKSQGYQSDLPYYDQFGIQSQNSETNAKKGDVFNISKRVSPKSVQHC